MTTLQSVAQWHFPREQRIECEVTKKCLAGTERSPGRKTDTANDGGGIKEGGEDDTSMALGPQEVLEIGSWERCERDKGREMAEREAHLLRVQGLKST